MLEWKIKFENIIHTVLGRTNVYLDGWKSGCKEMECNLGNFITDAFVDIVRLKLFIILNTSPINSTYGNINKDLYGIPTLQVAQQYTSAHGWTDAAIAIIQGGAMRSAIDDTKTEGNAHMPHGTSYLIIRNVEVVLRIRQIGDKEEKYDFFFYSL